MHSISQGSSETNAIFPCHSLMAIIRISSTSNGDSTLNGGKNQRKKVCSGCGNSSALNAQKCQNPTCQRLFSMKRSNRALQKAFQRMKCRSYIAMWTDETENLHVNVKSTRSLNQADAREEGVPSTSPLSNTTQSFPFIQRLLASALHTDLLRMETGPSPTRTLRMNFYWLVSGMRIL